jgi:uncharacterized protein (TIGR04255 family)
MLSNSSLENAGGKGMAATNDQLFPPSRREIYKKAPLIQVASQLRFPPILKIEAQSPVEFQENIRGIFPLFEKGVNPLFAQFAHLPQLPPEIMQLVGPQAGGSTYLFLTEDRNTNITLTPDSISLSTSRYERWEQFRDLFRAPLTALIELYRPAFFSRVGLRYIDAIHRESLGLANRPWSQLLRREILGELALPAVEGNVEAVGRSIRLRIPTGPGSVSLRHGLASVQGKSGLSYVIDFDFFVDQKTEVSDADARLARFNELAGRAFRWCISDALRDALGPAPLEPSSGECC